MRLRNLFLSLTLLLGTGLGGALTACSTPQSQTGAQTAAASPTPAPAVMQTFEPNATNSAQALQAPYVVMVSIDGYRWDYNKLFQPPALNQIASEGVAAESLQPIYPSKTFPNHYTLVTGLYSDRHGIVSNDFYDPTRDAVYSLPHRKAVSDGTWYFGDPLWIAAEKQGMLTASFFWVGSEANIQNKYPNYYYSYNEDVPNERRVEQVFEWLRLPAERRPHLILIYFSDVDTASHEFGTNTPQTKEAVFNVDSAIGKLREGLKSMDLPVNLIVVSDHGMADLDPNKVILIDKTDEIKGLLAKFRIMGRGPQMSLYLNKGEDPKTIRQLEKLLEKDAKNYRVHNRTELKKLHYSLMDRVGDLVIEPDAPYVVGVSARPPSAKGANHGWDAKKSKLMHGIFFAEGPAFRTKYKLPTFENIHVYPLVLDVLGLKPVSAIDGKLTVTKSALKPQTPKMPKTKGK